MANEPKIQKFDETYLRIAIKHMERFQPKTLRDEHHKEAFLFSMREMLPCGSRTTIRVSRT